MKRATAILVLCLGVAWSGTASATSITRTASFSYDPNTGLLTQEVVEPGASYQLTTSTTYDPFGNKIAVTTTGNTIAARTTSTTYDSFGRFVSTNTNALSQSETWQFDARFGVATSQTGPNGLTTTWSYDTFGRKVLAIRPDGTRTALSYQFCSGVNGGSASCITGAAYLIESTPLASDGRTQNGPLGIVYFDTLDREVGRDTQGFDGSTVRALRQYDSIGHVQQTSRPFFASGGTPQWTTYTYDVLDRALTTTLPDGSATQDAYHGLTTTETNALSQTRTVTKDARGEVISVTDALSQTMTYAYDPVGDVVSTTDAESNVVSATYDVRGRKITSSDPDLGTWSYSYDELNEVVSQTDAKAQVTSFSYDQLGRPLQRVEPDMTSMWVYDTAPMGVGKLASASITAGPGSGFQRALAYDSLGRPSQTTTTIGGNAYVFAASYDGNSRLSSVTYPSGFIANYTYNVLGYSNQLADGISGQAYWTLNALDAEQHITQQTSGNGVLTNQGFDPQTGRLLSVTAGYQNTVQNLSFTYDRLGNLLTRDDSNTNLPESFTYDALNRLTSATISTNVAPVKTFTYDPIGDLISKSDVGTYTYPTPGSPQPHAVTSISGGAITTTFTYDNNGNQTSGFGRTITWSSYNKPASITQGTQTISFLDDPKHQRFQQVTPQGTTLYFDSFGVHAEYLSGSNQWNDYLSVGNKMVGVQFLNVGTEQITTRYFHTDHLGSISVITDENGVVTERLSYDAWGKRRFPNGADDLSDSITSETTRGFTAQEELSIAPLVHLNGRVYDTLLGRMMSADPTVPDSLNPQAWNRYSYVGNDPLTFTDPTGFSWLSSFFHSVANFLRSNPIARSIIQIALAVILSAPTFGGSVLLAAVGSAAIVTGLSGGKLGDILKAATIAGATAFAFFEVGSLTTPANASVAPANFAANIAGHAAVGCLSAIASGGKCGAGALSAAVPAAASPLVSPNLVIGTAESSALGGLASVAGGGKFADGAVTGAFGYLFNQFVHSAGSGNLLFGDHDYTEGPNVICPASWACSAGLVASVYSQVQNGIPGNTSDALIVSGQDYTVYQNGVPVGQVKSYVGIDGLTVVNVTDIDHIFLDGWANRNAYEVDGAWYSVTHGSGTNYFGGGITASINQLFGPNIFRSMDNSIATQLYAATHH